MFFLIDGGNRVWGGGGLLLEYLVDTFFRRIFLLGSVPGDDDLLVFGPGQEGQAGEGAVRVGGDAFQERAQVPQHALNGLRVEAARVEDDPQQQLVGCAGDQAEGKIGLLDRMDVLDRQRLGLLLPLAEGIQRVVLVHEQALEEGLAARDLAPTRDLYQGAIFVLAHLHQLLLKALQPGQHGAFRFHVKAHRQGVDEQAHHGFGAGQVGGAARDGGAEDDVFLAAVTAQQQAPGGLHQRAEGEALPAGQIVQGGGQLSRQPDFLLPKLHRALFAVGEGPIHHQRGGGDEAFQLALPEGLRGVHILALQPHDVIAEGTGRR